MPINTPNPALNPTATAADRLQAKLKLAEPTLQTQAAQLWDSPFVRELYPVYLENMHAVVRSAVSLMQSALDVISTRRDDNGQLRRVRKYLEQHLDEEWGHDDWLLEDYEEAGGNSLHLLARMPSPAVASMVGAQYYWIKHFHPMTLLGHLAALEFHHPPRGFAQQLANLTGYPISAFRAIARHERLDILHKQDLIELINQLELQPNQERMIGISALHTMQSAVEVLADIYNQCQHLHRERVMN